jgi:hypothetical protein
MSGFRGQFGAFPQMEMKRDRDQQPAKIESFPFPQN